MPFLSFARGFASSQLITEPLMINENSVTSVLRDRTACTIRNVRNKVAHPEISEIPYVVASLQNTSEVVEQMEAIGGDVNNWVLEELSTQLFKTSFHELDIDQQAIIKTLGVYIMISLKDN